MRSKSSCTYNHKFQSPDVSPVNYGRYVDRTLDTLYEKQSRTADREERRRHIRDFEKRLLDEETHYIYPSTGIASSRTALACRAGRSRERSCRPRPK